MSDANPAPRTGSVLLAVAAALALIGLPMPISAARYRSYDEYHYLWEGGNSVVLGIDVAVLVWLLVAVATRRRVPGWLLWTFVGFTVLLSAVAVIYTNGATQSGHAYPLGLLVFTVECVLRSTAAVRLIRLRRGNRQPVSPEPVR